MAQILTRQMRLTESHVARIHREIVEAEEVPPGMVKATDADHEATIAQMLATAPAGEIWFFAYGSLIWKPACDFVEIRTALVRGWHRSFCLGWNIRHRGNAENPGLMLALDRGGACKGVLYRVPSDAVEANLKKLFEREMGWRPSAFPPRWVNAVTHEGPVRALTFCIDRKSGRYVSGLSEDELADVLATAIGARGSMAEYLHATVKRLEEMHIHDPHLWRLQELVASRIESSYGFTP
jgi:cation transport protein ChaC